MKGSDHSYHFFSQKLICVFNLLISKCLLSPSAPLMCCQWEPKGPGFLGAAGILKGQTGNQQMKSVVGAKDRRWEESMRRSEEEVNCWFIFLCISGAFMNSTVAHGIIKWSKLSLLIFCYISQDFILLYHYSVKFQIKIKTH